MLTLLTSAASAAKASAMLVNGPSASTVIGSAASATVWLNSATASSAAGSPPSGSPSSATESMLVRHAAGTRMSPPRHGSSFQQLTGTSP